VLAITRSGAGEPLGLAQFNTFKALAEQSAFSLFDAFLHHEAADKKQIEKDLTTANEVQRILLPSKPPVIDGYDVAGMNLPARYLSGDYFDYIPLDADRWGVVIADVSGKGVPAALLVAMTRTALRLLAAGDLPPAEVIRRLNAQLYPDIREDMFISLALVVLDRRSGEVRLVRAGHDAPLLYRAKDGSVTKVNPPGMAVGIDSGSAFNRVTNDFSLVLGPGDCLILYTDGVSEALDRNGEEFGLEAMIRSVQASASQGAAGIVHRVSSDVKAFIGDQPPHDDITLISILKK
jgi:sigma-B regulation protein RsbU (phosphoserine phosphatase)